MAEELNRVIAFLSWGGSMDVARMNPSLVGVFQMLILKAETAIFKEKSPPA